jgi:NADPH2:quinone reductase
MKAAVVGEKGVEIREVPRPEPKGNEVLVRVRAAALNRADLGVASGHRHGASGGHGAVIGLEWAGEVAAIGAEVKGVRPGDRVMCSGSGGYAEYAVSDWGRVSPIPANNMSYAQAATLPVALQTMHDALVTNGRLKPSESVLIQGASSGVGLMGLQIAKLMGAGLVIGTSISPSTAATRTGRKRRRRRRAAKASTSSSTRCRRASPIRT